MREFNQDGCAGASDLFGHAAPGVQGASDGGRPTEGFPNAYAEASQASSLGKAPVRFPVADRSVAQEAGTRVLSVEHDRDEPKQSEGIAAAFPTPRADEEKSSCCRYPKGSSVKELAPRLMTAKELAAYLGVSPSKVWRLEKQDAAFPKPIRLGGSTRWDRQDVDCYLDSLHSAGQSDR